MGSLPKKGLHRYPMRDPRRDLALNPISEKGGQIQAISTSLRRNSIPHRIGWE